MSAGLRNRFKVWHSSQKNVLCNEYLKKLTLFDEYWQICILCLAVKQMLCRFEGCPQASRKNRQVQHGNVCFIYFLDDYSQPVGCGWSISCKWEERSVSAGQDEQLHVTEWTCTWGTPDPSVTLCSHACSGTGLPLWSAHTHMHTHTHTHRHYSVTFKFSP